MTEELQPRSVSLLSGSYLEYHSRSDFTGSTGAARVRSSTASVHATREVGHRANDSIAPAALVTNSFRTRGFIHCPPNLALAGGVLGEEGVETRPRGFQVYVTGNRRSGQPGGSFSRHCNAPALASASEPALFVNHKPGGSALLGKAVRRKDGPSRFLIHQKALPGT